MKMTRRQFVKSSAIGASGILAYKTILRSAYPFAQSPTNIRKFVTTLPGLSPAGANNFGQYIPLATKSSVNFAGSKTDFYDIAVRQFSEKMHPDLPGPTNFFGYADRIRPDKKYLGGAIVATRGTPVLMSVTNSLPGQHILPVDPTIMAGMNLTVGDLPTNRIATHLHGGLTPWFSDGTPFQWFTPSGMTGESFMNVPGTNPGPGTATYYYPNDQSARLVWYHDHAIGITRLNAYAGIASAYIITDAFESFLLEKGLLPDFIGIPLVIQDKSFVPVGIGSQDPTWKWGDPGSLWYPHEYEANVLLGKKGNLIVNPEGRWDWGPTVDPPAVGTMPLPAVSAVPEFFADTAMVNGAPYPVLFLKEGTFRFRFLNGSQARFWHLNLYFEGSPGEPDTRKPGPAMYQIGNEAGFLPAIAVHPNGIPCPLDLVADPSGNTANPDGPFNLLLAPAERADVLINFAGLDGKSFILYSDAPAPFPEGDPRNDYFTNDPDQTQFGGAPSTKAGMGPNTRTIMKIVVNKDSGLSGGSFPNLNALNTALYKNFFGGNPGVPPQQNPPLNPAGIKPLIKTLNEDFDEFGRLIQRGGTNQPFKNNQGMTTFGQGYMDSITETPSAGETQVWDVYNNTGDTHPWHFHLVNVQVIGRGIFMVKEDGTPDFGNFTDLQGKKSKLTSPNPNELGWKETVRMNPGEVTRVIMRFDLPKLPASMGDPVSPRTGGHEYVHHCHILEHEEHDMMRALVVF